MPFDEGEFARPTQPACNTCKHYIAFSDPPSCAAFTAGIPRKILVGDDMHRKPFRGDNGIMYERKDNG